MARKPFVVTDAMRERVRSLAGLGVPQVDIARIIRGDPKTLRKHFRDELDCGVAEANAVIAGSLFTAAKGALFPGAKILAESESALARAQSAGGPNSGCRRPVGFAGGPPPAR